MENTISWTIPNTITVTLMVLLVFTGVGLAVQLIRRGKAGKVASATVS